MGNYVSPALVSPTSYTLTSWVVMDLMQQAYRKANALMQPGQGISNSEAVEGLALLNHMLDGFKIEALLCEFIISTTFPIFNGKSVYGVGPGQDWDIERPEKINTASFVLNNGTQTEAELPMFVVTTYQQWQQAIAKLVGGSIPLLLYYQATTPYGSATLWPVPNQNSASSSGAYVRLYTPGTQQEFQTVDDAVITPKGWREMLMYNLAVRVHENPPYNKFPMDPRVERMATFTKDRVMAQQVTPVLAYPDEASLSSPRQGYVGTLPRAWTPY